MQKSNLNYYLKFFTFGILLSMFLITSFNKIVNTDSKINYKYTYYAIPISISNTVGDHYAYTQYENIRKNIPNESHGLEREKFNKLITLSFNQKPTGPHAAAVPTAEDLGLVDFVTYSFFLFGNDKDSIFKFYLFLFTLSFLIFFFQFKDKPEFYLFSTSYLAILIIFSENFIKLSPPEFLLDRFTDNRNFSLLALIPYIHLAFYLFFKISNNLKNIIYLTLQVVILNFILFCRASIALEVAIIFCLFLIYIIFKYFRSDQKFSIFINNFDNSYKINLIITIAFCLIILPSLNKNFLPHMYSEYTSERHPTFVMLRAGLMIDNPDLKEKYSFNFSPKQMNIDVALSESGKKFFDEIYNKNKDRERVYYPYGGVNLVEQSRLEKKFIFHLLINDTHELFKNLIYYKPLAIWKAFKFEYLNYKTEFNFLKVAVVFLTIYIFLIINIKNTKSIALFFLIISPVTIKNLLFWGLGNTYFLDLFIIYMSGIIIMIYFLLNLIKNISTNHRS